MYSILYTSTYIFENFVEWVYIKDNYNGHLLVKHQMLSCDVPTHTSTGKHH